jgi:hypothetical protein
MRHVEDMDLSAYFPLGTALLPDLLGEMAGWEQRRRALKRTNLTRR